jgi:hypothetical protein
MLNRKARRAVARAARVPFVPMSGSRTPFKAALRVVELMREAMKIEGLERRRLALSAIPPLRSRGHGGHRNPWQRSVLGRAMQNRSRY